MTTLKPDVQINRVCLAATRSRVAVADLAFTSSKPTCVFITDAPKGIGGLVDADTVPGILWPAVMNVKSYELCF